MSLAPFAVSALGHALPNTRANRLLVLIYHRVHSQVDPMFPGEVDAERFSWQMDLLKRFCHPISLADGVTRLIRGQLPARAVAITFDDGYADNAEIALSILRHHGLTATFFVATGYLDGGRMWNDSIIEAVRRARSDAIDLRDYGLGVVPLGCEKTRGPLAGSIIKSVKHLTPIERQRRVDRLCEIVGVDLPRGLMMTSSEVRQLAEAGMEIGAHTVTHPILRTLSEQAALHEMQESRRVLEAIIGGPVRAFAYPNGRLGEDYTIRDRNLVASAGFEYALSTTWGAATQGSDVFQLPRFTPWDQSPGPWLARLLMAFRRIG